VEITAITIPKQTKLLPFQTSQTLQEEQELKEFFRDDLNKM